MSHSFVTVVPSFLLRGVDPLEVAERYKKGDFSNLIRTPSEKITVNIAPITFAPVNTESTDEPIYVVKDKNGYNHILVFSNQDEYTCYLNGIPIKRTCLLCGIEFFTDSERGPERIPLFMEDRYLPSSDNGEMTKVTIVWGDGNYCCPDHCFTAIRRHNNLPYRYRESIYRESEPLYRNICKERYPDLQLEEVDLRLLKRFGGSVVSESDFKKYTYNRMSSFMVVPVKIAYERMNK